MSNGTDAFDVMRYERTITELLGDPYTPEERGDLDAILTTARDRIDRFLHTGQIEFDSQLRDFVSIAKAIESSKDLPIVTPEADKIDSPFEKVLGERILKESNIWEVLYELQTAAFLNERGFDPLLVHEGDMSGPDIYVPFEGHKISIECKRRRPAELRETGLSKRLVDRLEEEIEMGKESYFVHFRGNQPLSEEAIEPIVNTTINIVRKKGSNEVVEIGEDQYTINLVDHFQGERVLQITQQEMEQMIEFLGPNLIKQLLAPFDSPDFSKGMRMTQEFEVSATGISVRRTHAYNLDFPKISPEHHESIMNTISRGREALSGDPPAVLFVYLPADEIDAMGEFTITDNSGSTVSQLDRLKQRIEGQLHQSNTLNSVMTNTHYWNTEIGRMYLYDGVSIYNNPSPKIELPKRISNVLKTGP